CSSDLQPTYWGWGHGRLRDELAHNLGGISINGDDIITSSSAVTLQLPRGVIQSLLGNRDGIDCGYESLYDAKDVTDDLGQEAKQLLPKGMIRLLGDSDGMDCGYESLRDTKDAMVDLGQEDF
ncbi:hypothetical protein J0S82_001872, partial [Galemys pyrenaicus]